MHKDERDFFWIIGGCIQDRLPTGLIVYYSSKNATAERFRFSIVAKEGDIRRFIYVAAFQLTPDRIILMDRQGKVITIPH